MAESQEDTAKHLRHRPLLPLELALLTVLPSALLIATWLQWWSLSMTEALGFATGGACVWLCAREHLWNWPLGLLNNAIFFVLFWNSRLFADMGLQVVFFAFGVYGWWSWLYGGERHSALSITRTRRWEWGALALLAPLATWALREILIVAQGAAPFWDALTTVLSLVAQYLICRKRLENWLVWMVADVIYVPVYVSRHLNLTAALYAVFLVMCIYGGRVWLHNWQKLQRVPT